MTNSDSPAFPRRLPDFPDFPGVTKRELAAMFAMQGLCFKGGWSMDSKEIATRAIHHADALLKELEATGK